MATLTTATAVEDDVLDAMKTIEDIVLRTVRNVVDSMEPVLKLTPELPFGEVLPAPAEVVKHLFAFVDKLLANQRDFAMKMVDLLPVKAEGPTPSVKPAPKAQAA